MQAYAHEQLSIENIAAEPLILAAWGDGGTMVIVFAYAFAFAFAFALSCLVNKYSSAPITRMKAALQLDIDTVDVD